MGQTVVVPLWLFVALVALAGWAALVLLLVPGMRWYLRGRINRVSLPRSLPQARVFRTRSQGTHRCNQQSNP